jgi:hypothetical protein
MSGSNIVATTDRGRVHEWRAPVTDSQQRLLRAALRRTGNELIHDRSVTSERPFCPRGYLIRRPALMLGLL